MKKPSFAKINYTLRPNKNVERKLIVECLFGLKPAFSLDEYIYIGMGSMWFVDFALFHKLLFIEKMISIEKEIYAQRAQFNKPYNCITVIPGDTSIVLPELGIENQRSIIWLDYDTGIDGPVLEDATIICEKAMTGSIFLITVNSNFKSLHPPKKRVKTLRRYGHDLVPPDISEKDILNNYPEILAKILFSHIKKTIKNSGRLERFYPLFNVSYADTSPMLTIGGMIANEKDKKALNDCQMIENFECITEEKQFVIDVPLLTIKEKIMLDEILPESDPVTIQEMQKTFPLDKNYIEGYARFYRHYPVFGEFAF